jgi:hypothetical protein
MKLVSKISKDYPRPQRVTHFWVLHSFPFFWTEITSWKIRFSHWNPQHLPHFRDQKSRSLPWWHRESFPEELWQGGTICLSMEFEHRFETPRTFQCWWGVNHFSAHEHLDHPFVVYSGCERTCNSFLQSGDHTFTCRCCDWSHREHDRINRVSVSVLVK